jgi:cellulose synthase/poly-beta-1,6-N-acetylglucosamine synthase-like glycosyltransferase
MIITLFWVSMALLVYTYLLYPVVLLLIAGWRKPGVEGKPFELPTVSFVVSAYNEEKVIEEKIANIEALDYDRSKLEVIIASDGSCDRTESIIRAHGGTGIKLRCFAQRAGKVNVLNRVIPQASGEIVVLSDANTMYEKNALLTLVKRFADVSVGCVCGRLVLVTPDNCKGAELESVYWRYESYLKLMEGRMGSLLGANGGIYAFRKSLFAPVPPNTIVEDFIIPMRILEKNYKVIFEENAVASEYTSLCMADEQVRRIRVAAGSYQALFMTLPMLNLFRGFPSFAYWSHKVLRWAAPFLLAALVVTNIFLVTSSFYALMFLGQLVFYAGALVGYISVKKGSKLKLPAAIYYFVSMNWCLLIGFYRFISGRQTVTWHRVER